MGGIEKILEDLTMLNRLCHGTVLDDAIALLKEDKEEIERLKENIHSFADMFHVLSEKTEKLMAEQLQIVRCKNCKHYHKGFNCDLLQKPILKGDDWFCADGERKDI